MTLHPPFPDRPIRFGSRGSALALAQTFHLGESMSVRLPTAAEYALAVPKEHRWLPVLAGQVPQPQPLVSLLHAHATTPS